MTHRQLTRDTPLLPAHAMKTYEVARPLRTHWRDVTCDEFECGPHVHGWRTVLDESRKKGADAAAYIRSQSGRRYTETREGELTVFTFPPGQQCFKRPHRLPVDREPLFIVRDGDWRGNPRRTKPRILRPGDWKDDFRTHQTNLAAKLK